MATNRDLQGLRCPDDGTFLSDVGLADAGVADAAGGHVCRRCHGSWLPGSLVTAHIEVPSADRLRAAGVTSERPCPVDGSLLLALAHHEVEIDVCGVCSGFWLDAGERDKLLSDREQASELDESFDIDVDIDASDDGGTLDSVGEVIGGIFDFIGDLFSGL